MANKSINRDKFTAPQREGDAAVRCVGVCLAEAQAYQGGDNKQFSMVLMFDKKNPLHKAAVLKLKKDLEECLAEKYPDEKTRPRDTIYANKPPLGPKCPIKDGDVACNEKNIPIKEEHPENAGHWIVRVANKDRPAVIDASGAAIDPNTCKSGYWYKVSINAYYYPGGSGGVTTGLNGAQLMKEDEVLGGGGGGVPAAHTMFDSVGGANPEMYKDGGLGNDDLGSIPDAGSKWTGDDGGVVAGGDPDSIL